MVFGHLTVTAATLRETRRFWPSLALSASALLWGAYLPDIVDKPLGLLFGLSSRGYAHSLVVQAGFFALSMGLFRRYRAVVGTVGLGAVIHLLEDGVEPKILLAPLLGPIPFVPPRGLFENIVRYYSTVSLLVGIEAVSLVYWIVVGISWWTRRVARSHLRVNASARESTPAWIERP